MKMFSPERLGALADSIWALTVTFVPRLLAAIVILYVASFLANRAARGITLLIARAGHVDGTLRSIVVDVIRYSIIVLAVIAALEQMGVRTTSLLAILGAAGLAIGLALQGTLSNIAAGIMLLWLRPFRIGDYVEVNNIPGLAGTVRQIGLFTCNLEAFDGLFLFVPNSALWNVPLRNYSRNERRLISLTIVIPRNFDHEAARTALLQLAAKDSRISKDPAPAVFLDRLSADGAVLNFRLWVTPQYIGALQREIPDASQAALVAAAPESSTPIQVVRVIPPDSDPSRLTDFG